MRNTIYISIFISLFSSFSWAARPGYLHTEDDQVISVFSMPGVDWSSCQDDPACKTTGWLPNDAKISVIGEKKVPMVDPKAEKLMSTKFYEVEFSYIPKGFSYVKSGKGWVNADYISESPVKTFYGIKHSAADKEPCPPTQQGKKSGPQEVKQSTAPLAELTGRMAVNEAADILKNTVGQCVFNPKGKYKFDMIKNWGTADTYDVAILPSLQKAPLPRVVGESGAPITREQLVAIDALARTIYGEAEGCFAAGLEYPIAAAKILSNRAEWVKANPSRRELFDKSKPMTDKNALTRVVTAPSQLNVWIRPKDERQKPTGPFFRTLCPPQKNQLSPSLGIPVPEAEVKNFEYAIKIATEAVLFPKQFAQKTSEVDQLYFTTKTDYFFGMKEVHPRISGRKISNRNCLQIWNGKP